MNIRNPPIPEKSFLSPRNVLPICECGAQRIQRSLIIVNYQRQSSRYAAQVCSYSWSTGNTVHYSRLDRTYVTLINARSMETILRARSRSPLKRGNRQFTFGNPGEQRNVYRSSNRSLHPPYVSRQRPPHELLNPQSAREYQADETPKDRAQMGTPVHRRFVAGIKVMTESIIFLGYQKILGYCRINARKRNTLHRKFVAAVTTGNINLLLDTRINFSNSQEKKSSPNFP